jgi:hypothetical protein
MDSNKFRQLVHDEFPNAQTEVLGDSVWVAIGQGESRCTHVIAIENFVSHLHAFEHLSNEAHRRSGVRPRSARKSDL